MIIEIGTSDFRTQAGLVDGGGGLKQGVNRGIGTPKQPSLKCGWPRGAPP